MSETILATKKVVLDYNLNYKISTHESISAVHSLSHVQLFVTPWTAARQASLSITNSQSSLKPMSINLVMPSNHLILCHPLLLPPIPPSIRVFSNESTLHMRWPKYWSFSFSISPSKENPGLISFRMVLESWAKHFFFSKCLLIPGLLALFWLSYLLFWYSVVWAIQWSCMDVRVGLWRKLSAEELMFLNCGAERTLASPLNCKEIQPVHPKGDQSWVFIGRTDAKAESPILWPSHVKSWLIGKDWGWEGLRAGGEGDNRGWDGWMISLTRWTWVWVNSRSWWWTGRPGMLQFMGSQRVGHDWAT